MTAPGGDALVGGPHPRTPTAVCSWHCTSDARAARPTPQLGSRGLRQDGRARTVDDIRGRPLLTQHQSTALQSPRAGGKGPSRRGTFTHIQPPSRAPAERSRPNTREPIGSDFLPMLVRAASRSKPNPQPPPCPGCSLSIPQAKTSCSSASQLHTAPPICLIFGPTATNAPRVTVRRMLFAALAPPARTCHTTQHNSTQHNTTQ